MKIDLTKLIIFVLIFSFNTVTSFAVEPDEILSDSKLENRAREISANIRCVVCQNEPIDSSNSGVARDLRILIRERLSAGDSDAEVLDFLVKRYGDFVLFKPPLKYTTYVLWFSPIIFLFFGTLILFRVFKRAALVLEKKDNSTIPKKITSAHANLEE
ncbi:MAG: cytochrome c-type biogenesis protein CcmH [Paracoccaceae bacterium]